MVLLYEPHGNFLISQWNIVIVAMGKAPNWSGFQVGSCGWWTPEKSWSDSLQGSRRFDPIFHGALQHGQSEKRCDAWGGSTMRTQWLINGWISLDHSK